MEIKLNEKYKKIRYKKIYEHKIEQSKINIKIKDKIKVLMIKY